MSLLLKDYVSYESRKVGGTKREATITATATNWGYDR
jgi:hypothetical protein